MHRWILKYVLIKHTNAPFIKYANEPMLSLDSAIFVSLPVLVTPPSTTSGPWHHDFHSPSRCLPAPCWVRWVEQSTLIMCMMASSLKAMAGYSFQTGLTFLHYVSDFNGPYWSAFRVHGKAGKPFELTDLLGLLPTVRIYLLSDKGLLDVLVDELDTDDSANGLHPTHDYISIFVQIHLLNIVATLVAHQSHAMNHHQVLISGIED